LLAQRKIRSVVTCSSPSSVDSFPLTHHQGHQLSRNHLSMRRFVWQ